MHNLKDLWITKTMTAVVQQQKTRLLPSGFSAVTPGLHPPTDIPSVSDPWHFY